MSKSWFYQILIFIVGCLFSTLVTGSLTWITHPAQAQDTTLPTVPITAVSQLEDLSPSDPYFEAVKALTEQYGCVSGFSDNTFRAEQPTTRGEVAIVLHSCLQTMAELIRSGAFSS